MKFLSRKVKLYESGWDNNAKPINIGSKKIQKASSKDIPQYEQQRRAMERIYKGKRDNFGKGVGP